VNQKEKNEGKKKNRKRKVFTEGKKVVRR